MPGNPPVEQIPNNKVERANSFRGSSQGSTSPVNSPVHPATSAANKVVNPISVIGDSILLVAPIGSSQDSDDVAWSNTLGADDATDDFSIRDPHFDLTSAKMTKLFSLCNPDDSEMLSYDGFRSGLGAMGIACDSDKQFQAFVDVVDDDKSGTISYGEFLSAIQEIKLAQLFNDAFVRTMPPLYASLKSRSEPSTLGSIEYSPDRIRSVYPINRVKSFIYSTKPEWATVRWINVEGLNTLLIRRLSVRYRLHPLAVEATLSLEMKRPKYVKYDEHSSLVLQTLHPRSLEMVTAYQNMYRASLLVLPEDDSPFDLMDQGELESRLKELEIGHVMTLPEQLSLFVMNGVLISVQAARTNTLWSALKQRLSVSYSKVRQHSTAFLVYTIMDVCVNEISPISQTFGAKLVMLERLMLLEPRHFDLGRIANCSKQIKALQMHCKPLFEIISKLVASDDYKGETLQYFADIQDLLTTIEAECEQNLDRCRSLVDDFNNARSAQQNDASYILALIAAIFLPAQFLTGVYGMNFPYIPETRYHYAYFIWWAVMLVVAALIVLLFKLKKWL
ncbi:CorA Metal Ion transporter (MIT) Family [Phytophthora cinnamomi]|uniref:CorA Metal Ion transporter (MIT) Family n=1 Tax=Phytophthora cinnamomi TaxID=4785 RepID=UPI00355AC1DB|nr:CorA Metal Ion transporter (MIT) Family [Phytophthora cinnamomi]